MSYAAANIVDFIRGFHQRAVQNQVNDAEKNYLSDPTGTIKAVYAIDPASGVALQNQQAASAKAAADLAKTQADTESSKADAVSGGIDKVVGYLHGLGAGQDPDAALANMTDDQLGVPAGTIATTRRILKSNPNYIQASDKDVWKAEHTPQVVAPGSEVVEGGQATVRNPLAPKYIPQGSAKTGFSITTEQPEADVGGAAGALPPAVSGLNGDPYAPLLKREGGTNADGSGRISPAGAKGAGQIMDATGPEAAAAAGLPWDPQRNMTDPAYSAALGRAYHAVQIGRFGGDMGKAAAAYNAGPGRVARASNKLGPKYLAALPAETQAYVKAVAPGFYGGGAPVQVGSGIGGARTAQTIAAAPDAPKNTYRAATPEEIAKAGYPEGTGAQIGTDGKMVNVHTPPAGAQGKKTDPVATFRSALDGIDDLTQKLGSVAADPNRTSYAGYGGYVTSHLQAGKDFKGKLDNLNASKMVDLAKGLAGTGTFSRLTNMEATQLPKTLSAIEPGMSQEAIDNQFHTGLSQLAHSRAQLVHEAVRQGIATQMKDGTIVTKGESYKGHVFLGGDASQPSAWRAQ